MPASGSFSATYTTLGGGFTCGIENFAKRVGQGDYRVLVCGVDGTTNPPPVALATDTSFNDFVGIQLVTAEADAITTCAGVGRSTLSEFKVTTRDASGNGQDEPFNFAELGT